MKKSPKTLEEFVAENRADFEEELPQNNKIWEKLSAELSQTNAPKASKGRVVKISVRRLWQVAAALLILIGVYFGVGLYQNPQKPERVAEQENASERPQLAELNPELAEAEAYYTRLIAQKNTEIKQFIRDNDLGEHQEVQAALNHLDSMYVELKQEFYQAPAQEQVVAAMIKNLQMRINILNQQLEILQRVNQIKTNKQNETSI